MYVRISIVTTLTHVRFRRDGMLHTVASYGNIAQSQIILDVSKERHGCIRTGNGVTTQSYLNNTGRLCIVVFFQ